MSPDSKSNVSCPFSNAMCLLVILGILLIPVSESLMQLKLKHLLCLVYPTCSGMSLFVFIPVTVMLVEPTVCDYS